MFVPSRTRSSTPVHAGSWGGIGGLNLRSGACFVDAPVLGVLCSEHAGTRISAPIELTIMEEVWKRYGDRKSEQDLPEPSWLLRRTTIVRREGEARLWQLTTTRRTKLERLPCLSHVETREGEQMYPGYLRLISRDGPSPHLSGLCSLIPMQRLSAAAVPQQPSQVLTADWSDPRSVCRQPPPQRQK